MTFFKKVQLYFQDKCVVYKKIIQAGIDKQINKCSSREPVKSKTYTCKIVFVFCDSDM